MYIRKPRPYENPKMTKKKTLLRLVMKAISDPSGTSLFE